MNLRNRLKNPRTLLQAGLVCLALSNLAYYFVSPRGNFPQDLGDGIRGLLLGLAIGLLTLFLHRRRNQRPTSGAGPCA